MKVLYIHQYFKTFADGGSSRSYYLAKALIEQGCQVEMITSYGGKTYKQENIEGISVHYLPVYYDNSLGTAGRIWAFLKFIWKAYRLAASIPQVNRCYATSTPLTIGIIALLLKYLNKIPFSFEVRDLWPLAPIQMGIIRHRLVQQLLYGLEHLIYREADQIIALSPGMAESVAKVVNRRKIHMIPNIADCQFFKQAFTAAKAVPSEPFTITYFGATGPVNHVEYLLEVARYFQEKRIYEVRFQIVGKGQSWEKLQQLAQQYQLANLAFIPHVGKHHLRKVLATTHATYVSFAQKPVLETSSPNKFFDGLAAGKLCIVNTHGWMKDLVEENACGFYADPNAPDELLQKLLPYLADADTLKAAQLAARQLAENQFSRTHLTRQFINILIPATTAVQAPSLAVSVNE